MKTPYILFLLMSFFAQADEQKDYNFFDNALTMTLSSDLKQLSATAIDKRYSRQANPPNYAFNNKDNNVTFTITQYPTPANKKSMNKIHKTISNMLRNSVGKVSWKKDKVYSRKGTKIAAYEYEKKAIGKYQYNLTYVLPINGRLTFIAFMTSEKKQKSKWLSIARESLDSLILTK